MRHPPGQTDATFRYVGGADAYQCRVIHRSVATNTGVATRRSRVIHHSGLATRSSPASHSRLGTRSTLADRKRPGYPQSPGRPAA